MQRRLVTIVLVAAWVVGACGSTAPTASTTPRPVASGGSGPVASGDAPQPAASADAGPAFVGPFAPIELKGKGNKDVTFEIPEDAIAIASMAHPAKGTFNVTAYDEDGKVTQELVKANGKYAGTVLFDLKDHSVAFKVQAKGPWKIVVKPAEAAKPWDGAKATKGKGDQVLRLTTPAVDGTNLLLKTSGTLPYAVRAHSPDDDIDLMNGTSPAKITKALPAGTDLLEIVGRGPWQVSLATK